MNILQTSMKQDGGGSPYMWGQLYRASPVHNKGSLFTLFVFVCIHWRKIGPIPGACEIHDTSSHVSHAFFMRPSSLLPH